LGEKMRIFHLLPVSLNAARVPKFHKTGNGNFETVESDSGVYTEFEINEGLGLYENDIVMSPNEQNVQTDLSYRWPEAKLFIDVGSDVSPNVVGVLHQVKAMNTVICGLIKMTSIFKAIRELEAKTDLTFKRRDRENDYINIYRGGVCSSSVGRQRGRQQISLADGCDRMATIMHEFTHALGVMHAHMRPDRDEHVIIHWENINPSAFNNFAKVEGNGWTTFGFIPI